MGQNLLEGDDEVSFCIFFYNDFLFYIIAVIKGGPRDIRRDPSAGRRRGGGWKWGSVMEAIVLIKYKKKRN